MRSKNLYALERMECQEVSITTDDMCSVATHGQFKKLVVLWIAASGYLHVNVNPLHLARQCRKKTSNIFLIQVSAKLLSI